MRFLLEQVKDALDLPLPARQTAEAAGMDLFANIHAPLCLPKGARALVPLGIKIALPPGYEAQIRPRSGLALHHGVTVLNTPGTVDADYRGELKALLINLGENDFTLQRGNRIAQMVIAQTAPAVFEVTDVLPESLRGEGGYGSTGR